MYSGDSNYSGSSDATVDECFDVTASGSSDRQLAGQLVGRLRGDRTTDPRPSQAGRALIRRDLSPSYACGRLCATPCTSGSWTKFDTESLSGTTNPSQVTSAEFTPASTGYLCSRLCYSGDSNYSGSSDSTVDECFDVTAAGPTITKFSPASGKPGAR